MSASKNPESLTEQGAFRSKVPASQPMTTKGHAPGVLVGNDKVPEFHAETYPPGTAPEKDSFAPHPDASDAGAASAAPAASETLQGATSGDVHRGHGHPGSEMTGQETEGAGART